MLFRSIPKRQLTEEMEKAVLVGVIHKDQTERQVEEYLDELAFLAETAGASAVKRFMQKLAHPDSKTYIGKGKLEEVARYIQGKDIRVLIFDDELTGAQITNIEKAVNVKTIDRSDLILDIFARRAKTAQARAQVELAQYQYILPRLRGMWKHLERLGGGIGTRGPGETQLEKDRRAIARRIEKLQRDVRKLGEHRARLRGGRRGQRRLALVGYTNAGKSSLLNALSHPRPGEAVLAENKLFATLDPTTRRIGRPDPAGGPPQTLLLTDTVGFIRDLPPPLVEAFRSTLEETLDADQLLLVVDLADPGWSEQLRTVHTILDGLDSTAPRRLIGNQIDRCPAAALEQARLEDPQAIFVSATAGLGLEHLRDCLFAV